MPSVAEADAEQPVHHQSPRLVRHLGALRRHGDAEEALLEQPRHHARVAAVVSRPGEDQNIFPLRNYFLGKIRCRGGCALHELRLGHAAAALDAPDVLGEVDRAHFFVTPTSASGSQVASSGNAVMIAMQASIMRKNGSEASAT